MFQVEPVLWLQSLESPIMTWIMTAVTFLGYVPVYAFFLIILTFGLRLKQGFFLFLVTIICGLLIFSLKPGLAFPRPSDVDIRVIEPGNERPPLLVEDGAAKDFWGLPSTEAMGEISRQTDWNYGFPSGHVGLAAAFSLGLAFFFFRSRAALAFSVFWILLMTLSRMYLGRHFIADALGGMAVGVFSVALAAYLAKPLNKDESKSSNFSLLLRWAFFAIPLALIAPFVDLLDNDVSGMNLAFLVSYAYLLKVGFPRDKASVWKRVFRVIIAMLSFIIVERLFNLIGKSLGWEDIPLARVVYGFLVVTISIIGTMILTTRLKLFEPEEI